MAGRASNREAHRRDAPAAHALMADPERNWQCGFGRVYKTVGGECETAGISGLMHFARLSPSPLRLAAEAGTEARLPQRLRAVPRAASGRHASAVARILAVLSALSIWLSTSLHASEPASCSPHAYHAALAPAPRQGGFLGTGLRGTGVGGGGDGRGWGRGEGLWGVEGGALRLRGGRGRERGAGGRRGGSGR